MKSNLDRLFDDLQQVGHDNKLSVETTGWKTTVDDSFAIAGRDSFIIPVRSIPVRRTEGIKAGHRVVVSFRSAKS